MDLSCLGIAFLFGACALLVLPVGAAAAGPCTTEIDSLTKLMALDVAVAYAWASLRGLLIAQQPWRLDCDQRSPTRRRLHDGPGLAVP